VPNAPRFATIPSCLAAALLLATATGTAAPESGPSGARAVDPIVAAERAFAAQVRSQGVREGFLAWLAPTSVVFRPGPVSGPATYRKQPSGWHGLLSWTPAHAAVSADGKLGWSTGPWTWQRDSTQAQPDAQGEYMTVWRQKPDGVWKAVLDCGIGHPAPARRTPALTAWLPSRAPGLGSRPLAARKALYEADAGFARLAAAAGVAEAISHYADDDVIVLREGAQRWRGRATARDSLSRRETRTRVVSNAQNVAGSGDIGYTYGTFVHGPAAAPDSAWYVHVWHRGPAPAWKLAFEVVMPVPAAAGAGH